MKISRQILHSLLFDFNEPNDSYGRWFASKASPIRFAIETLRGDPKQYARMDEELNDSEMVQLIDALMKYIDSNTISNMKLIDNRMIHSLMCTGLLFYELDTTNQHDAFRNVIDAYFSKLNHEINSSNLNNNNNANDNLTSLDIWLQHVVDNPELYIKFFFNDEGADYSFPILKLSECACQDVSHNRLLSHVRHQVEKIIIDQGKNFLPASSNNPLKILDLGAGKGLQSFIIVLKLLKLDIDNIELTLVEPDYESLLNPKNTPIQNKRLISFQKDLYSIIRALSLLAKTFNHSNLTIYQYHSVESLKNDKGRNNSFDVIYAIDFVEYEHPNGKAQNDFHALANCLSPEGIAILSNHYSIEQFKVEQNQNEMKLKQITKIEYQKSEPIDEMNYEYKYSMKNFFTG